MHLYFVRRNWSKHVDANSLKLKRISNIKIDFFYLNLAKPQAATYYYYYIESRFFAKKKLFFQMACEKEARVIALFETRKCYLFA